MSDRIRVDTDLLRQHAMKITRISDDVSEARAAVQHVTVGGQAFGVLCAFAAAPTTLLGISALGALQSVEQALLRASRAALQMADDFDHVETKYVHELDALRADFEGWTYV